MNLINIRNYKMKLKTIFLPLLCIAMLNGCGVLPQKPKAVSDNWQGREAARLEEKENRILLIIFKGLRKASAKKGI